MNLSLFSTLTFLGYFLLFYWGFILVVASKNAWNQLPFLSKLALVFPALAALLMDLAVYWLVRIALCDTGSYPGEWTFSQLLGRYKFNGSRVAPVAFFICSMLDPFEIGGHCKKAP